MITVNHEPLTETSDENFKLHSVNEEYETEQFPDIEAEIIDKPVRLESVKFNGSNF